MQPYYSKVGNYFKNTNLNEVGLGVLGCKIATGRGVFTPPMLMLIVPGY